MLLTGFLFFIIFNYFPFWGIRITFYEYGLLGPKYWIGFRNFIEMFHDEVFLQALYNTFLLSLANISLGLVLALFISLLLNEVTNKSFIKTIQTIIYLPPFISWVVVASIFYLILSPQTGVVNAFLGKLGIQPIYFLASEKWWRFIYLFIARWRDTGWGTVIFLAALANIDHQLYEAAWMDGATRWQQMRHITMPHLKSVIIILLIVDLSKIFNIFESVFVLCNPLVYKVSDVLGTFVYRRGFAESIDYDFATAVGLFKSLVALVLVLLTNFFRKKIGEKSIF